MSALDFIDLTCHFAFCFVCRVCSHLQSIGDVERVPGLILVDYLQECSCYIEQMSDSKNVAKKYKHNKTIVFVLFVESAVNYRVLETWNLYMD